MPKRSGFRSASLVLTSRCNLRCGYCYQNDKKPGRMSWATLRRALDLMLASEEKSLRISFWGGEPLLEFPAVRRAVRYLEDRREPERRIEYSLSTNGLLLDDAKVDFLAAHGVETQLSFDGIRAAQNHRGRGTFDVLDRRLDRIRERHPGFYEGRLQIALTLTVNNLPHLADSIDYFLGKDVREIGIAPDTPAEPAWRPDDIARLDEQVAQVFESSVRHYRRTGRIPLSIFRTRREERAAPRGTRPMCGAVHGRGMTVDVDGEVHGCLMFAGSYQRFRSAPIRDAVDSMRMGNVHDEPGAADRAGYRAAVERSGLFHRKERKYSSYGKCGECEYIDRCTICPMSTAGLPGNRDPDRVPDFPCAFHKVFLRFRDRFPSSPLRTFGDSGPFHDFFAALEERAGPAGLLHMLSRD